MDCPRRRGAAERSVPAAHRQLRLRRALGRPGLRQARLRAHATRRRVRLRRALRCARPAPFASRSARMRTLLKRASPLRVLLCAARTLNAMANAGSLYSGCEPRVARALLKEQAVREHGRRKVGLKSVPLRVSVQDVVGRQRHP